MRFTVHSDYSLANGSSYMGTVHATYYELVHAFGPPMDGDGDKTQAEWVLEFEIADENSTEKVLATVYDWKRYSQSPESITVWNIGGFSSLAPLLVDDYLNYIRDMESNQVG